MSFLSSPATPLNLISGVVIDTETTGLDPARARIVQLGGVRIRRGALAGEAAFDRLVNPGCSIPEASTRIHGIGAAHVKQAPKFAALAGEFEEFVRGALLIGFAIGFDLAVLRREYALIGRRWIEPRRLDIRPLARHAMGGRLADDSLDAIAAALGVSVDGRHTALGDAHITAAVFLKLVPLLRKRGVHTLAEALTFAEAEAGVRGNGESAAIARIDSFPYRHRVRDIMASSPVTLPPAASLREVLAAMMKKRVSSVFVQEDGDVTGAGIITERDILRLIDAKSRQPLAQKAGAAASRPLHSVHEDDFVYRAIGRMNRLKIRHLAVTDRHGKIVGALSARDLLRQRAGDAISMGDALDEAQSVETLTHIWARLPLIVQGLDAEGVDPRQIAAVISHEVCNLTRRAAELAEDQYGGTRPAGLRWCVMVLGSGGRGESLLALDQDNAIVFDPGEAEEPADRWLRNVAKRLNAILDEVGVPLCKGGVMARNAAWRKSSDGWRAQIAAWLSRSDPEDILNADIFFDAASVHGACELGEALRRDAVHAAAETPPFLKLMAMNAVQMENPLGWFRRISTDEKGRIDLKRNGILPIFSAARILALQHRSLARSTEARLRAVRSKSGVPETLCDHLIDAHRMLLGMILSQQLRDIARGLKPSNRVAIGELTAYEREQLRWALAQVQSVGNLLGDPLG